VNPVIAPGTFFTVKLQIIGSTISVYLNDALVETVTDASIPAGGVGLLVANTDAEFDDVVVTSQ
jgi:pectate lyase